MPASAEAWSRYWASGAAHSCVGSYGEDYRGAIARWWDEHFVRLRPADHVLDIGTGGGPLPRRLVDRCDGDASRLPTVSAVDAADVHFAWVPEPRPAWSSKLRVFARTRAEALPLPDACVDLACSQFGIEYAPAEGAVAELRRVLKPQGRAAFVLHAEASLLVDVAGIEAGHLDWLRRPSGFVDRVRAMLPRMALAASPEGRAALAGDAEANAARLALNAEMGALAERAAASAVPDALHEAREAAFQLFALAGREGLAAAESSAASWVQALDDAHARQRGLLDAAMGEARLRDWAAPLVREGRTVNIAPLGHDDGRLLAWGLEVGPKPWASTGP